MGALLFIFCLILGFGAGYVYRSVFGGRKKTGLNSYIQTGEILLDAGCNKEISGITSSHDGSNKSKLLNKLTKMDFAVVAKTFKYPMVWFKVYDTKSFDIDAWINSLTTAKLATYLEKY